MRKSFKKVLCAVSCLLLFSGSCFYADSPTVEELINEYQIIVTKPKEKAIEELRLWREKVFDQLLACSKVYDRLKMFQKIINSVNGKQILTNEIRSASKSMGIGVDLVTGGIRCTLCNSVIRQTFIL